MLSFLEDRVKGGYIYQNLARREIIEVLVMCFLEFDSLISGGTQWITNG